MSTDIDFLVLGDYLLDKRDQPASDRSNWQRSFAPD
jgi:hypothetical protein